MMAQGFANNKFKVSKSSLLKKKLLQTFIEVLYYTNLGQNYIPFQENRIKVC